MDNLLLFIAGEFMPWYCEEISLNQNIGLTFSPDTPIDSLVCSTFQLARLHGTWNGLLLLALNCGLFRDPCAKPVARWRIVTVPGLRLGETLFRDGGTYEEGGPPLLTIIGPGAWFCRQFWTPTGSILYLKKNIYSTWKIQTKPN